MMSPTFSQTEGHATAEKAVEEAERTICEFMGEVSCALCACGGDAENMPTRMWIISVAFSQIQESQRERAENCLFVFAGVDLTNAQIMDCICPHIKYIVQGM